MHGKQRKKGAQRSEDKTQSLDHTQDLRASVASFAGTLYGI